MAVPPVYCIQLFQLRLSPEQSGRVEYERERLLGIANKWINLLAIPSSLLRSYSTFPLCSWDNLNWNTCIYMNLRSERCTGIAGPQVRFLPGCSWGCSWSTKLFNTFSIPLFSSYRVLFARIAVHCYLFWSLRLDCIQNRSRLCREIH